MTDHTNHLHIINCTPTGHHFAKALADGLLALSQMTPTTHGDHQIEQACNGIIELVSLSRGFRAEAARNHQVDN